MFWTFYLKHINQKVKKALLKLNLNSFRVYCLRSQSFHNHSIDFSLVFDNRLSSFCFDDCVLSRRDFNSSVSSQTAFWSQYSGMGT